MIDYTLPLDQLPDPLPIEPLTKPFDITITPPGSKSITCRAYILAALAEGESQIIRPLRADDTDTLLKALCTLGAEARWQGDNVHINGVGGRFPRGGHVNLGDGGAPTRFMIAAACLAAKPVVVDASPRMRRRPIAEGIDMLRQLGAKIDYVGDDRRLPVAVVPAKRLRGGELEIPTTLSSQFISALLLIGAYLPKGLDLRYSGPVASETYLAMTYRMMMQWGVRVRHTGGVSTNNFRHRVRPTRFRGRSFLVEPDASGAVYWWTAALLTPAASVMTPGISSDSNQPDSGFLNAFWLDPEVQWKQDRVVVSHNPYVLLSVLNDCSHMPDAAIALAVVAAMCPQPRDALSKLVVLPGKPLQIPDTFTLGGLHTLRIKETDRIAALANELRKIGCTVETTDDSIAINPSTRHDKPVVIETYNDHRMAMAFAVLGLARPGISIKNPACVSKSYPTFWKDFAKLYQ